VCSVKSKVIIIRNAAIAALAGAVIGFVGNALSTWINRYFDEKKARRELMVKTAWDQWSTEFNRTRSSPARLAPLEVYLFHTLKVVDLATRTNLSNEQIVVEVRKIRRLTNAIIADIKNENAAKAEQNIAAAEENRRKEEQENWKEMIANNPATAAPIFPQESPETKEK
jgi:hypothetical protein